MLGPGWPTIPRGAWDTSMLHRLFPNLDAPRGVEFSPERHRTGWDWGTSASTAGKECVLKLEKSVSLTYHLHVRKGNRMVLRAMGLSRKLFRAESGPKMRLGCIAPNLSYFAPALISSSFTSLWPFNKANSNAVAPSFVFALTSAPLSSSACTTSLWPSRDAPINAVVRLCRCLPSFFA